MGGLCPVENHLIVDRTVLEELPVCNKQEKMLDIVDSEAEPAIKSLKKEKHLDRTIWQQRWYKREGCAHWR